MVPMDASVRWNIVKIALLFFLIPAGMARLIIEIDGGQHDLASDSERARTAFLQAEGYRVLRFWNNEVLANPEGLYAVIAEALQKPHPHPNPPPSRGRG